MSRVILHVDMDAFFASVEQRENPEFRGKPLIVGADPKGGRGRGVVAACSYEARKFGVHSALPIGRAFRLCPHAVFVRPHGSLYSHVSRSIMEILGRYTDLVEPVSIDEAFLDVAGSQQLFGKPPDLAARIKHDIRSEQRLTCSIGIAPNKFLAKVASDLHKPDGLFEVQPGTEKEFLKNLPIGRIWGVGPKTEERLRFLGISTIGEVAERSRDFWRQRLGQSGEHLWELSQGIDSRPVQPDSGFKSMSQEHTFGEDTDNVALMKETLLALCEELARRARQHNALARTVALKLRFEDFTTMTRQKTLPHHADDALQIYQVVESLLEQFFPAPQKIRLLGVGISHFQDHGALQLGLFDRDQAKKSRLNTGVDAIVARYGPDSIAKASLIGHSTDEDEGFSSFLKK
ncbi:MAG TPA: DNA polymerase IV [Acidobacteriota bacterium]|jgi:nucleotidyltransferase/DNA polymerase involved in DNA repair